MTNAVLDAIPGETIAELTRNLEEARSAIQSGMDLDHMLRGGDAAEIASSSALADKLCEEGSFGEALPHALKLMLRDPGNHRHSFMAAECLEEAGLLEQAVHLFAHSLAVGPTSIAAFRLGECLEASSRTEEAIRAFDRAAQLAGEEGDQAQLLEEARERAHELYTSQAVAAAIPA